MQSSVECEVSLADGTLYVLEYLCLRWPGVKFQILDLLLQFFALLLKAYDKKLLLVSLCYKISTLLLAFLPY